MLFSYPYSLSIWLLFVSAPNSAPISLFPICCPLLTCKELEVCYTSQVTNLTHLPMESRPTMWRWNTRRGFTALYSATLRSKQSGMSLQETMWEAITHSTWPCVAESQYFHFTILLSFTSMYLGRFLLLTHGIFLEKVIFPTGISLTWKMGWVESALRKSWLTRTVPWMCRLTLTMQE